MVDRDLLGRTVVLAVAQKPFEKEGESGVWNTFSTLVPVLYDDGRRTNLDDFPHNKDVWWMIRSSVRGLADPGRSSSASSNPPSRPTGPARPATRSASKASRRPARRS